MLLHGKLAARSAPSGKERAFRVRNSMNTCHRQEPRYRFRKQKNLIAKMDNRVFSAKAYNISSCGMGFLSDFPVTPETALTIVLDSSLDNLPCQLPAHVVHATKQDSGQWLIGCALENKLPQDTLLALL